MPMSVFVEAKLGDKYFGRNREVLEALVSSGTFTLLCFWGGFVPSLGDSQISSIFLLHSLMGGVGRRVTLSGGTRRRDKGHVSP